MLEIPGDTDSDALDIDIQLDEDEEAVVQLGNNVFRNEQSHHQYSPREFVTAKDVRKHFHFHVKCHGPQFGTFDGRPACLILFDHVFSTSLTTSRFKRARIRFSFEDSHTAFLDPDDEENDAAFAENSRFQPRILAREPQQWKGPEARGEGYTSTQFNPQIPTPIGPFGIGSLTRSKPVIHEECMKINSFEWISPVRAPTVEWTVEENKLSASGLVPEFTTPIIVGYSPGRCFIARIEVSAVIEWRPMPAVAGKKDDPLIFDTAKLGGLATTNDLKQIDLKPLCRLSGQGGRFLT